MPAHYVDAPFRTEIDCFEGGKTYEIAATNEPTKGWLRLTKTDRKNGNPVAGVTFDIYENDAYGNARVGSMTTDENGIVRADNLVPGNYLIRETRPLDGYAKTNEEIAFTIDESYVPPQKLARITNTPVIQTGIDFPIAPLMAAGLLMMAASVLLGLMRLLRKKHR